MLKTSNKSLQRIQEWYPMPPIQDRTYYKHPVFSKLCFYGLGSLGNLEKLHANNVIMVTHIVYILPHDGKFQIPHITKLLKRAKNLKDLTIRVWNAAEKFEFQPLLKAAGRLKLKRLVIVYRQKDSTFQTNFLKDLVVLLKKMSRIEKLELKFENVMLSQKFDAGSYRLPFGNLTEIHLSFGNIESNIDKWIMAFGKPVGKALYKNLADPRNIHLKISKINCPKLTPLAIYNFLANFDKIHLTNYVDLEINSEYTEGDYPIYTFGDLFLMFITRKARFKLNLLEICNRALASDMKAFTKKNQILTMNKFRLSVSDGWSASDLKEGMKCVKLFQVKKEIYIRFPKFIRHEGERDEDEVEGEEDYEDYYTSNESSEEKSEDHLFDIVVTPILSTITKKPWFCLDFRDSRFDEFDYSFLVSMFEEVHKPISELKLLLPGENVGNEFEYYSSYSNMYERDMVPVILDLVCSMYNVTTCTVDINRLDLGWYEGPKEELKINQNSSLEKLIIDMYDTDLKPKVLVKILRMLSSLPKLKAIEVWCAEAVYEACRSVQSVKSTAGKTVTCNFILD